MENMENNNKELEIILESILEKIYLFHSPTTDKLPISVFSMCEECVRFGELCKEFLDFEEEYRAECTISMYSISAKITEHTPELEEEIRELGKKFEEFNAN